MRRKTQRRKLSFKHFKQVRIHHKIIFTLTGVIGIVLVIISGAFFKLV